MQAREAEQRVGERRRHFREFTQLLHHRDECIELHLEKQLDIPTVAMAKLWCSERAQKVADMCLQLHGGYGYMNEYPIARAWADLRVSQIYAGTSEIMKEIISRSLPAPR